MKRPLSDQQILILKLTSIGFCDLEIAKGLEISTFKLRHIKRSAYRKLGTNSAKDALDTAASLGWIEDYTKTKKKATRSRKEAAREVYAQNKRRATARQLKQSGMSYSEIGREMGISRLGM
ncbi:MAG TPA: hypothetical protein VJG32_17850 [Anaerolineae bacterium]|nr:hypothetical protein [Anaerolineae bacterium]